jgi:hypothetical protein
MPTSCRRPDRFARRDLTKWQLAGGKVPSDTDDATQVGNGGRHDVHPRIRIVHPVDGHLVNTKTSTFGDHQQFGIEEPLLVGDKWQQLPSAIGADRFEAALRIGEPRPQCGVQQHVVGAGDQLAFGPAHHATSACQARADREVAVARQKWRDKWQQRVQVRGKIDVHVGEHSCAAVRPRRA